MISVLIADTDQDFAKEIGWALQNRSDISYSIITSDFTELESIIVSKDTDVILAGPNLGNKSIMVLIAPALRSFPRVSLVCSSRSLNQDLDLQELEEQGIESQRIRIINFPTDHESITETIQELYDLSRNKTDEDQEDIAKELPEQKPQIQPKKKTPGKLITVFSTKGGVGKTVIATNLAVCLAQRFQSDVALVDLDLQFGDVGVSLKLNPKHTIYDAVLMEETLNEKTLNSFMTVNGTGVKALLAPLEPEVADLISSTSIQKIIQVAKKIASFVIIDTPPTFNDHVLAALEASDLIYLVTTMDIASVKNIKLCLQTLQLLGCPKDKTRLLINRTYRKSGLRQDDIEKSLESEAVLTLPRDKMVPLSSNQGMPTVVKAPRTPFSKSIYRLSQLTETPEISQKIESPSATGLLKGRWTKNDSAQKAG